MNCSTSGFLSFVSQSLLKLMSTELVIQSSHPLPSPSPPAFHLSQHQCLYNKSALHIRWPKYWSFNICPYNEYSELIFFRIDWFDLILYSYNYYAYFMMRKVDLLEKTLMLAKIEGKRRQGQQRMRWLDGITDSMDMNLRKLWQIVEHRGTWHATVHRVTNSSTQVSN